MVHFPPDNYTQTESYIPGIEVYKQVEEAAGEQVLDIKCPRCQSPIAYSLSEQGLRCAYCGYHEELSAVKDPNPEGTLFEEVLLQQTEHGWGTQRTDWFCNSCGATTSVEPEIITFQCPFCGSQKVIQHDVVENASRPQGIIPFKFDKKACPALVRQWLGSSWMTPASLQRLARLADFKPVYLPFWVFEVDAHSNWRAQYSSGIGATRHTKTGYVEKSYADVFVIGTAAVNDTLVKQIARFDIAAISQYNPKYLSGIHALTYDITLSGAWQQTRQRIRQAMYQTCTADARRMRGENESYRDLNMEVAFEDERWRYILAPVYIALYRYKGTTYQLLVNGQTGAVGGQRPVDWVKVRLVQLLIVIPLSLLAMLFLSLALKNFEEGMVTLILWIFVLWIFVTFTVASTIERKARRIDAR